MALRLAIDVGLTVSGDLQHNPGTPGVLGLVISPRTKASYLGYDCGGGDIAAHFSPGWEDVARRRSEGGATPPLHEVLGGAERRQRLAMTAVGNPRSAQVLLRIAYEVGTFQADQ